MHTFELYAFGLKTGNKRIGRWELADLHGNTDFLTGDGELVALIGSHDWSASRGDPISWPQSLKTTVGMLLCSPVPIVLLWGDDGIMIYNDAYSVTDTGVGMTPDVMEKAFDPFFTTKGVEKGTGLGLSQVYGFVRQSGGNVKIYSEPGVGTTVKIYLPRHLGATDEYVANSTQDNVDGGIHSEIIMVVEDEERVRAISVEALRDLGYTVIEASRPTEAIRLLEQGQQMHLLLTDVVMLEMSGREMADILRRIKPDLKFLFTTGYTRNAIVHNGFLDAGTNLLSKPFSIDVLAENVRTILDQP